MEQVSVAEPGKALYGRTNRKRLAICLAGALMPTLPAMAQTNGGGLWQDLGKHEQIASLSLAGERKPARFRRLTMDPQQLADRMHAGKQISLDLPVPEGGYRRFSLEDSGVMPTELAAKYPALKSYKGRDKEGRHVRLDLDGNQMQATVWDVDESGAWSLQPESPQATRYIAYRHAALPADQRPFEIDGAIMRAHDAPPGVQGKASRTAGAGGAVLYDFRIAVATDSQYTAKFGGTVEGGLSGVIRAVNQVNEIFENDLGVHLTLVAQNDKLIRTDPRTDPGWETPYAANRNFLNRMLGESAYDVGILFNTGFGGAAGAIGNTCVTDVNDDGQHKAAGFVGHPNPVSDPLFVSVVAHELGHKFGAWHTANGCERITIDDSAFEPGSGTTLMSYAGVGCPERTHELQAHPDRYFHAGNLDQIQNWLQSRGGQCASKRLNPNPVPWIDRFSLGHNNKPIPARTAFFLDAVAEASDPMAVPTYTWEQMDVGPEQLGALIDDGVGPIFRSFPPSADSQRAFPSLPVLLGEAPLGVGEVFPATTRSLNFRLTVRDNFGTMATTASADKRIHVIDTGEAFAVTAPKALASWRAGAERPVRWKVAGTNRAPIDCPRVSIDLSIDGGHHYLDQPLLSNAPNSGQATIIVPNLANQTSRARIRVRCDNNIFFALSPGDFVIRK